MLIYFITTLEMDKKSAALWNLISYRLYQGRVIGSVAQKHQPVQSDFLQ